MTPAILAEQAALEHWLVASALPLWSDRGIDAAGGFHELLGPDGLAVIAPRRCFTAARQLYVFSVAPGLGWSNGDRAAAHARETLEREFARGNGLYATSIDPQTGASDDTFDLYDHAFVLFAFAVAYQRSPNPNELETEALETLAAVRAGWSHPTGGFEEARPRRLPLRANPHMHLFEAALQWIAVKPRNSEPWDRLADEIAELCLRHFIDPQNGALHEFFDGNWRFASGDAGRIVEPGHQFEWAWLLTRWATLRGRPDALAAARRMAELAETSGVREGYAINELWDDLTLKDGAALLWPQTERIKAWVGLALVASPGILQDQAVERAAAASVSLRRYLDTATTGLWFRERDEQGKFRVEPSPTRYFYHILCAIQELQRLV